MTPRPAMLMWHGCNSDPIKFMAETQMFSDDYAGKHGYYALIPRGTSSSLAPHEQHANVAAARSGESPGVKPQGHDRDTVRATVRATGRATVRA